MTDMLQNLAANPMLAVMLLVLSYGVVVAGASVATLTLVRNRFQHYDRDIADIRNKTNATLTIVVALAQRDNVQLPPELFVLPHRANAEL